MLRFARACGDAAGRLVGVALVALGGHACAYRSLRPAGHDYLAHYQPAVLLCGLLALLLLVGALALAWAARWRPGLARLPGALFGGPRRSGGLGVQASALAGWGLVWLVAQESLEQSIALGRPAGPALAPSSWLLALVALGVCALLVSLIASVCVRATKSALARRARRPAWFGPQPRQATPTAPVLHRRPPLSERRGLRAPPLPAG